MSKISGVNASVSPNNPTSFGAAGARVANTRKRNLAAKVGSKGARRRANRKRNLMPAIRSLQTPQQRVRQVFDSAYGNICPAVAGASSSGMLVNKQSRYLASLIDPREFPDARVPDPYCRERTATYQSKVVYLVEGVNGAAVGATTDAGRFSYVFNPIMTSAGVTFNPNIPGTQVAYKDGTNPTALWTTNFANSTVGTNFDIYNDDPETASFANAARTAIMSKCRPVSMSVLASYVGNLTAGGGNIAAALVPGGTWGDNLAIAASPTPLANWENLARVPGAYDGPLVQGAYTYWLPDDSDDYLFRDVQNLIAGSDAMSNYSYPLLVISGKIQNATTNPQIRLDVYINYEYTTVSRVVATSHGSKSLAERLEAVTILADQPTSMPNDQHIDWIKVVLGGAAGFLVGGPVGAVLGAAAGAGVSGLSGLLKGM